MPAAFDEPVANQTTSHRPTLAPWQHTVFLVSVLILWAIYGGLRSALSASAMPLTSRYLSNIVMQALLAGSTLAGVYHRREFLLNAFCRPNVRLLSKDIVLGVLIFIAGVVMLVAARLAMRFTPLHATFRRDVVQGMLPQSHVELAL